MHSGAKRSHNALKMYVQEHKGVPGSKKRLRCSGLGEVAHLFSLLSCWMWASAAPFDRSRVAIRSRCTEKGLCFPQDSLNCLCLLAQACGAQPQEIWES